MLTRSQLDGWFVLSLICLRNNNNIFLYVFSAVHYVLSFQGLKIHNATNELCRVNGDNDDYDGDGWVELSQ